MIRVFKSLDQDGTGKLTKKEIKDGFETLLGKKISDAEITKLFSACDTDGSGQLEYTEFMVACMDRSALLSDENLEITFRMLDKDGSGFITKKDL